MRNHHRNFLCALDIGSKKITLAAAGLQKGGQLGPIFIETQNTKGIFKGVVNDLTALGDSIGELLRKTRENFQVRISQAALSINGNYIQSRLSLAAAALSERGTRSITKRDAERLTAEARTLGLELDEHLLSEYVQGFCIDKHIRTMNPLGLHGRKLEMELLLVCAQSCYIENVFKAVEQCGVDVLSLVFSGAAAAKALVSDAQMQKGVILVDIGHALTSVSIFKDGVLRRLNIISFGGINLTEIIANYFTLPFDAADNVKDAYVQIGRNFEGAEEAMVRFGSENRALSRKDLGSIIGPEIDKFTGLLKSTIFGDSAAGVPVEVIVTGGLSLLEGLLEKMESDLGLSVRLGRLQGCSDIPASKAPCYASAVGLLFILRDMYQSRYAQLKSPAKNKFARALDYVVNLYQDYF